MKVSIITIAFNSEQIIAKTLESVLQQNIPELEYIIIDGASKDRTLEVVETYRGAMEKKGINFRVYSEPDEGIYDAMNKGISLATGEIIGLINSGDWYENATIKKVIDTFESNDCDLLYGDILLHKSNGETILKKAKLRKYQTSRDWNHPTMFVKASVYKENMFLKKGIHDDYGCYLRMVKKGYKIETIAEVLAHFQMGGASNRKNLRDAINRIKDRYRWCYRLNVYSRWYIIECIIFEVGMLI